MNYETQMLIYHERHTKNSIIANIWKGGVGKREICTPLDFESCYQMKLKIEYLWGGQSGMNFWRQNLFKGEELSSTKLHAG
jgi:hypothetical protein